MNNLLKDIVQKGKAVEKASQDWQESFPKSLRENTYDDAKNKILFQKLEESRKDFEQAVNDYHFHAHLLKLVCLCLDQIEIPYMLTGSLASNFYAVPRMTRDIDFVIVIEQYDIEKFFQVFHKNFYINKIAIQQAISNESMFNIIHNDSVFKIDFFFCKNTPYRKLEFQRRRQVQFGNDSIYIVSPEDLIISKLHWAKDSSSELQLKDIQNLLSTLKNLDQKYLDEWIKKLGLIEIFKKVKFNA